jgi:hypothetical protein
MELFTSRRFSLEAVARVAAKHGLVKHGSKLWYETERSGASSLHRSSTLIAIMVIALPGVHCNGSSP